MATLTPADAVADVLVAQTFVHGTKGTNLFTSPELRDDGGTTVPVDCCFVVDGLGGPTPERMIGSGVESIYYVDVQIVIRNDDRNTALTRARTAAQLLQVNTPTGYIGANLVQGEPVYIGPNDKMQHRYSVNLRLLAQQQ